MKIHLNKSQRKGLMGGKVKFSLEARAELTSQERENVAKYKMGKTVLYYKENVKPDMYGDPSKSLFRNLSAIALNESITVDSLVGGKVFECKDILEIMAIEEQIRFAAQSFKTMLDAAAGFEGSEVIEMA